MINNISCKCNTLLAPSIIVGSITINLIVGGSCIEDWSIQFLKVVLLSMLSVANVLLNVHVNGIFFISAQIGFERCKLVGSPCVVLLSLSVHHSLLFHALSILYKLVVKLVVYQTIEDTGSDDEVTLWDLVTKTSGSHQLHNHWLWCLHPIRSQFLVTNSIEEHILTLSSHDSSLAGSCPKVTFCICDLLFDSAIESCIHLGESELSLACLNVLHLLQLCQFLTQHF